MDTNSDEVASSPEHSTEFMDQLKQLLQQHHDHLVVCLQRQLTSATSVPAMVRPPARASSGMQIGQCPSARSQPSHMRTSSNAFAKTNRSSLATVETSDKASDGEESRRFPSTFSQSEALRRNVSLHAHSDDQTRHSVTSLSRSGISRMVGSYKFDVCMSVFIVSNALFCGIEAEYAARTKSGQQPLAFFWISCWYSAVFAAELLLRVFAEGCLFFCNASWKWNYFDVVVVSISLSEAVIGMSGSGDLDMPSLRIIRMVRVIRVLRIARVMRNLRSLRILVQSVISTLKSLLWTLLLLALIIYVFAILFTEASTQYLILGSSPHIPRLEDFFGSVGTSAFSLLKTISGGVNWADVVEPLVQVHPVWVCFFLVYFMFTYFAVLNVVTGVFCQTAIDSAHKDHEMAAHAQMAAKQNYITQLQALFKQINTMNTGMITLREFEDSMQDEKLCAYFASIDLSIDEAFSLFKLLDRDEAHKLDIDTFVTGCLKLRGQAKSIDVAMMMYETRWGMQRCLKSIKAVEDRFLSFQHSLSFYMGPTQGATETQVEDCDTIVHKLI